MPMSSPYPAAFSVDYPDRPLDRLTSFFRILTIIPIAIVLSLLSGVTWGGDTNGQQYAWSLTISGITIFMPLLLMILFRKKYPRWWFDWNVNFQRFSYRVGSYLALLRDEYPSTDEEQAVRLDLIYPNAQAELSRGMPLVKWFLAIPHYIILTFLGIGAFFVWIIAWFAILFTGRYPRGLFNYIVGVLRWGLRVTAYAALLITDRYPPFSLEP
jgi:hypothetical protein